MLSHTTIAIPLQIAGTFLTHLPAKSVFHIAHTGLATVVARHLLQQPATRHSNLLKAWLTTKLTMDTSDTSAIMTTSCTVR